MELCPETLDITVTDGCADVPAFLFQDGVLNLQALFQEFIRAVGKALSSVTNERRGVFQAENGVTIEADFTVCDRIECKEDDGCQKIVKYVTKTELKNF